MGHVLARSYLDKDLKLLFGKSGMYCAFPECRQRLLAPGNELDDEAILGHIAHIVAHSDTGPRSNPDMPASERNRYDNLVLLCAHHHGLVDAQHNSYTIDDLRSWKSSLEAWVDERLTEGMREVRFVELEAVCTSLTTGGMLASTGLTAVPPTDKMDYNELTDVSRYRMTIGLMQARQVGEYLEEMATRIESHFPQRLRSGFVTEYQRLSRSGLRGDALFFAMEDFAFEAAVANTAGTGERFEMRAAALAVLCHLFEVCDVFEEPSHAAS